MPKAGGNKGATVLYNRKKTPMKHICIVLLTSLTLFACALDRGNGPDIVIDDNSTVIDVRTAREYNNGHLNNAVNIPYDEIQNKIGIHVHSKNEKIVLYCRTGRRSGIALKTLQAMGYTNAINAGSYKKLKRNEREQAKKSASSLAEREME